MSFKDFRKKRNRSGAGYEKIRDFCAFARTIPYEQESWDNRARLLYNQETDGIKWVWVDTVCIDKRSSAELSEAINSMYHWYAHAQICIAHLSDVSVTEGEAKNERPLSDVEGQLRWSRWFSRGWTLQELIAPSQVVFVDREWRVVGTKNRLFVDTNRLRGFGPLTEQIATITSIPKEVLSGITKNYLGMYSVAKRMSWAANRYTTRTEDLAYSLLGIFDINMPLLYGEGRSAFRRLQEEIVHRGKSNSIFAWRPRSNVLPGEIQGSEVLARSPAAFAGSSDVVDVGGSLGSIFSRKGPGWQLTIPAADYGPTIFQYQDLSHYIVRLQCCRPRLSVNLKSGVCTRDLEPCVMILQVTDCNHLRRAFDGRIFAEDDIQDGESYKPLENPQTLYVHSSNQDILQCFGSRTGLIEGRVVQRHKEASEDDDRSLLAKFRDSVLNSRKSSVDEVSDDLRGFALDS